jgi:hypothetical protein
MDQGISMDCPSAIPTPESLLYARADQPPMPPPRGTGPAQKKAADGRVATGGFFRRDGADREQPQGWTA